MDRIIFFIVLLYYITLFSILKSFNYEIFTLMNRQKIAVYVSILLDVLGIGILIPATTSLMHFYNLPDYAISLWIVAYSLCSFLAAPLMGQLSDIYGRKRPLVASIVGSSLSWVILFISAPRAYFLARIVNGITGGNMSILQAILTDIAVDEDDRKKNFWLLGAMFGLGFVVWPILGSLLMESGSVHSIFLFGLLFAVVNIVLVLTVFKETNHHRSHRKVTINPFPLLWKYVSHIDYRWIMISLFFVGVASFSYQSIMAIIAEQTFGVPGSHIWYYLAGIGVITIINQVLIVPKFWIKKFTNKQLLNIISLGMIPGVIIMLFAPQWWIFILGWFSIVPFWSLMQVGYNNEIVKKTDQTKVGEAVGVLGSVQSLVMFVGPLIGSFALAENIPVFIFTLIALVLAFVAIRRYLYLEHYHHSK